MHILLKVKLYLEKIHFDYFLQKLYGRIFLYRNTFLWQMEIPEKPEPSDCCNSGCNPCILDIYERKLNEYNARKTKINANPILNNNILKLTTYTTFKLISAEPITSCVNLYTFDHPDPNANDVIKFIPGQYFILKGNFDNGEATKLSRPYTPLICTYNNLKLIRNAQTANELFFQIAVKMLPNGAMSQYLKSLKLGDITLWRGPYGDFNYKQLKLQYKFSTLVCFTQGIGIAPIFCIIDSILADEIDETIIALNCCFRDIESIIFRKEIQDFNQFWNFKSSIFLASQEKCDCIDICKCTYYSETIYKRRMRTHDIENILKDKNLSECYFLICGNQTYCEIIESTLLNLQIFKHKIHVF